MASLKALRDELEQLPQAPVPRAHPRNWWFSVKRNADLIGHSRPHTARFFARMNPYPKPWEHVRFEAEDGVSIYGWLGLHPKPAKFGIVIVPGIFSTKDDSVHKRRAIHLWRHWQIPVLSIDPRAFGESTGIATGGWKEALDIHAAAKFLAKQAGVERIGVIAESMGGAAALNANAHDSEAGTNLLRGGVLTWSAFVDVADAVAYISTKPPDGHPFRGGFEGFRRLLRLRSGGAYDRFDAYMADAARVNGLPDADELFRVANPKWKVSMMSSPTLLIHARDDPIVPVRHARRMQRYAREHDHIQVLVTDWGGHTGFEAMEPWWYWEVTRRFFGHVNGVELPNLTE